MPLTLRILCCLMLMLAPVCAAGQPPGLGAVLDKAGDQVNSRNDLEGGIWEYKVIERRGTMSVLVGKVRIKQSAAFDVPGSAKGSMIEESDAEEPDDGPPLPFGKKGSSTRRLGVLDQITESNRGGDRIGDVNYEKSRNSTNATPKVSFRFDTDDEHPLSGEANVKYDTRNGGGVWRGYYDQELEDGKNERWKFELRFIED